MGVRIAAASTLPALAPVQDLGAAPAAASVFPASVSVCRPTSRAAHPSVAAVTSRLLDVAISVVLLVALFPVMVLIVALIRLTDGGPAIFWQTRVGHGGRLFWFPKFRSMRVGAEDMHDVLREHNDHEGSVTFKMKNDPRLTRLGRIIRTLSLDELPQLWSVIKGDMALVGPRPPLPNEVLEYTPTQFRRLEVKPGLTCIWQVNGRSTLPFDQMVALDIEYIENRSLWLDLKLLLLTIPAVLSCKGAY